MGEAGQEGASCGMVRAGNIRGTQVQAGGFPFRLNVCCWNCVHRYYSGWSLGFLGCPPCVSYSSSCPWRSASFLAVVRNRRATGLRGLSW